MPEMIKPGSTATQSGVCKAVHAKHHIPPHYITAIYGDTFPVWLECSDRVRFEIALSAVHVHAHPQFNRSGS